ncbi:hypothetical protein M422DRAFT_255058 [Sphaerobolus stellatus SS14]|uniref:Uncharacterized protein n=1 Tax=Sphaerobolus stellatus (strain SS14) TaxID=990650 RepID=A0A0C9UFF0_SPHS4|nr:hypothetical protein M422DRAFT_255058 [Sphaerobolus stellatus SS14]
MDICTNIRERTHEKPITQYPLPITNYRKPNDQNSISNVLSWRSSGSVLLGLEGCSQSLFDTRMRKKVRELKLKLRDELYAKFSCPYDYKYMLGPNPSVAALALAEEPLQRIIKRIGSLLRADIDKDPSANFFKMMFDRVRRPIPRDIWYQENEEEVGPLVRDEMIVLGWNPATSRQQTLPIEMAARKKVFEALPDEEQEKYLDKAAAWKPKEPTRELLLALPKLLFTIGDSMRKVLGWSFFIWAGGLNAEGKPSVLHEEWLDNNDPDTQAFLTSKEFKALNTAWLKNIAAKSKVPIAEVQIIQPYRPKVAFFVPRGPPRLMDVLEWNKETQTAKGDEPSFEAALNNYFNDLWPLVPPATDENRKIKGKGKKAAKRVPPWDAIDKSRGVYDQWLDPARLPVAPKFQFSAPGRTPFQDLKVLATHIIKGEKGLLPSTNIFQRRNQQNPPARVKPPVPGTKCTLEPSAESDGIEMDAKMSAKHLKLTSQANEPRKPIILAMPSTSNKNIDSITVTGNVLLEQISVDWETAKVKEEEPTGTGGSPKLVESIKKPRAKRIVRVKHAPAVSKEDADSVVVFLM